MNREPAIFFQSDREGQWLHVDPAWQTLTGTTATTWLQAIHHADRPRIRRAWQDAVKQHQAFHCTYRLVDGHTRIEQSASATASGFIGSLIVTALPQVNLLDLVFGQAFDGLFVMLLDEPLSWHDGIDKEAALDYAFAHQRVTRVNQAMLDQYGAQEVDFLGKTPADFFAHDVAQGREQWRQLFDHGHSRSDTYEQRFDGSAMIIEGDYTCLYDDQGHILGHFGIQRDVTQQRTLENALADQKKQLERIMQATPNGVYIYDLHTHRNSYANQRISEILGYTYAEIVAQGSTVLSRNIHPDDWPRVEAHLQRCLSLEDRQVAEIEYRFRHGDGHWCWLLSRDVVFRRTAKGEVQQILGVLKDITERKQLEIALRESETYLSQLLDNQPAAIYRYEIPVEGAPHFTYFSQKAREIFELDLQTCLADPDAIWALIHPEDADTVVALSREAIETDTPLSIVHRLLMPDGRIKWLRVQSLPRQGAAGTLIRDGVIIDISDIKVVEQQLSDSLSRFEQLTQNVPALVYRYEVDSAGHERLTYLSPRAELMFELPISACLEDINRLWALIEPADASLMLAASQRSRREGTPWHVQFRLTTPSGIPRWIEADSAPTQLPNGSTVWDGVMLDISERKAAEQQLRDSELRWQFALEGAGDGVWDWNVQTGEAYFSHQWKAMLGYADHEIANAISACDQLLHPDDLNTCHAALKAYFAGKTSIYQNVQRLLAKDGTYRWILDRGQVLTWTEHGEPLRMIGTHTDITAQKQLEASLQQQIQREQVLNIAIRAVRESLDLELIFAAATQTLAQLYPLSAIVIRTYKPPYWELAYAYTHESLTVTLPQQVTDMGNTFAALVKQGQPVIMRTSELHDQANQQLVVKFPGIWLAVPIKLGSHLWGATTFIVSDETYIWHPEDLQLIEAVADQLAIAIQQSELYIQLKYLNSSLEIEVEQRTAELETALSLADLQTQITEQVRSSLDEDLILQTAVDSLGSKLGLIRCSIWLYFEDEPHIFFAYGAENTGKIDVLRFMFPSLDDTLQRGEPAYFSLLVDHDWFTAFLVPICDEQALLGDILVLRQHGTSFLAMEMQLIQQVAAQCAIALRQSRLYQAAQEQVSELQRLNRLKDDFLSTVSHELRTPMTSIKLAIQMLEARLGTLDISPTIQTYINILRDESDREIRLITDLLDMAKLEAGTLEVNLNEVDGCRLTERLMYAQSLRTNAQQQTVVLECMPNLPPITTDAVLLERVLAELLHNAVKYTPAQETITISLSVVAGQFAIAITNTGVSLPRRELSLIFDKFYRLTNIDQWKHGGTGLGLALVKQIVIALGGTIWASSTDTSTTFNVHLPLSCAAQKRSLGLL